MRRKSIGTTEEWELAPRPSISHCSLQLANAESPVALSCDSTLRGDRSRREDFSAGAEPAPESGATVNVNNECPLEETDDRFREAHYFVARMMDEYHNPVPFRYNLNAFIQALRNVTFVLQKEFSRRDGFQEWYQERQETMKEDHLLHRFADGRNLVVKQRGLEMHSKVEVGIFRGRTIKFVLSVNEPLHLTSEHLINHLAVKTGLIHPDHHAIDEQYGVRRKWYSPELGEGDVVTLCDLAWVKIGRILSEAHDFAGWHSMPPIERGHRVENCEVLLEMDLDPSLPRKWGWVE